MTIFRKRLQRFARFNGETCHISDLWARLRSFQTNSSTSSSPFTDSGTYVTSCGLWSSASVCWTYVTRCGLWSSASAVGTDKTISTVVRRPRSRLIYDNLRPREGWRLKRKFNVLNLSSSWSGRSFSYGGNVTILCVRSTFLLVSYIIDLV